VEAIRATRMNGRIVPDGPVDWPEGCRLVVEPEAEEATPVEARDEVWSNSAEAIADWLAWYDSLEPLEITTAEEADLADWR
jgi:hypothetical protein